jgi:putative exosortase-associated protein (TIGR04073 family)
MSLVVAWLAGSTPAAGGVVVGGEVDAVERTLMRIHAHPALHKLGRGVANLLCGWIEFPVNVRLRYTEQDAPTSLVTGMLYGVIKGLARTGIGAYETATFFLPVPAGFAPILPPLPHRTNKLVSPTMPPIPFSDE